MKNLLEFLGRHYHWLVFLLLEAISLVMFFNYNSYQNSVWLSSANTLVGSFYQWTSGVESYFSLRKVNEDLTVRNYYLERQVTQLRRLYAEATQTVDPKEQQGLDSLSQYQLITAKVVSNELGKRDNLMTIDKGEADGVETGMGVACGRGVVGVTYLVSKHYAVVIPVLNVRLSRISCAIRGSGYFGVLRWYGKDAGYAYVEDIPRHARFKRGDWVETNGYSSIFPAGILVGQIVEVYNASDGLSYKLKVRLSTDFGNLRDVVVISEKNIVERTKLINTARESMTVKSN